MALNYLSILWADSGADALMAANKLLLYLVIAWSIALVPWTPARLAWILGLWSLAVAVICGIDLIRAHAASDLGPFFYGSRYATPLLYPNATAALPAMALWPALLLSARREVPPWARIVLFPVATFLAGFAFLPQSRGALVGLVVTTPVVILIAGRRIALIVRILLIGAGLAVTVPRTVSLYQALSNNRPVHPALHHATQGLLITTLAALAVSVVLVLVEQYVIPRRVADWRPRSPSRNGRRVLAGVLVVVLAGGAVAAASPISHAVDSVIKKGNTDASTGSNRLLSATPEERFDYVRAAWKLFKTAPILGVGAGNFGRRYDALRKFEKHSQYTHDLGLRVLAETGIVGVLLFLGTIGALIWGIVGAMRRLPGVGRAAAVSTLAMGLYFLVHASVDWMDEFPVLAAPALALALAAGTMRPDPAVAMATDPAGADPEAGASRRPRRLSQLGQRPLGLPGIAAFLTVDVLLALALAGPYLEIRYEDRAQKIFRDHPSEAYAALRRAADVNPLSPGPMLYEGAIAISLEDDVRARSAFRRAIAREDGWYPRLELGVLLAQNGQFAEALAQVRQAAILDRDDPLVAQAEKLIRARQPIDPLAFNAGFLQGVQADIFRQRSIK